MINNDTIVAISTPHGLGGIAIVRLSGPSATKVADAFFCAARNKPLSKCAHAVMNFGRLNLDGVVERGYGVVFFAPHSFTGEDVVELQVHGGTIMAEKVVAECIKHGARIADRGEFSKRAFLNGKASLESLEGMIDMISAESEAELRAGSMLQNGELKKVLDSIEESLTSALAEIDVTIDYPDEIDEEITAKKVCDCAASAKAKIDKLLQTKKIGRLIKDGVKTLIIGKPNVGKSSVLNAIVGEERAIVTDVAGTTRDVVKETFVLNGTKFVLLDTAGIRETSDKVESIGVERAKQNVEIADLILFLIDGSEDISDEDKQIFDLVANKNTILVLNKTDKKQNAHAKEFFDAFEGKKVAISTVLGDGMDKLIELMQLVAKTQNIDGVVVTNQRHVDCLAKASEELGKVDTQMSMDILSFELKTALTELGKITGKTASEEVVAKVFSKFCVGK